MPQRKRNDMPAFNIDFNKFKPSSLGVTKTTSTAPPVKTQTAAPIPRPVPTPAQPAIQKPEQKGLVTRAFDLLNKPSELTEKFLTAGKGYDVALNQAGIRNVKGQLDVNDVLSTAGRFVLDPLNLIPIAKVGTAAKFAAKGLGLVKGTEIAAKAAKSLPFVEAAIQGAGKRFVQGYGLPAAYNIARKEIPTTIARGTKQIVERTTAQFGKPISKVERIFGQKPKFEQDIIEAIPKFLEPNTKVTRSGKVIAGAGSNINLGALKNEINTKYGAGFFESKVQPVLHEVRKQFDEDIHDLVLRGKMNGQTAKELLTQGGYYPRTDFAPKALQKFFPKAQFAERRGYLKARKGAEGFTYNAPKAIARRELSQFQDNTIQDFLKGVKEQFGVRVGAGEAAPEGYKVVKVGDPKGRLAEVYNFAFPENVADDLTASFSPAGGVARAIDKFNAYWKPTATSLNPSFHLMNAMGNMYNVWLGGMKDPRRFKQLLAGGFSTADKAILEKTGVLARNQFAGDIVGRTFDNPEGIKVMGVLDKFRKTGEVLENNARSAFFLDQRSKFLRQGLSDIDANRKAVGKVNEYLFDYLTGLTPFESNVMRRFFPFYTWSRFNLPLQAKALVTQPQKVAVISKIYRDLNKGGVPNTDQEGLTFPTPFTDEQGQPIRFKPNLPVQDIFNLNPISRVGQMFNPLFKEGASLGVYAGSGGKVPPYDLFTGKPRTDPNLPADIQAGDIAGSLAQSTIRPVREYNRLGEQGFNLGAIARRSVGGFYSVPVEFSQNKDLYESTAFQNAINDRIRQVLRSKTLSRADKEEQIRQLRLRRR